MKYAIWDKREKEYLRLWTGAIETFDTEKEAEAHKDKYLDSGNYIDYAHDVLQVRLIDPYMEIT